MKLADFIHAPTRTAWTARLVVYVAIIVTISIVLQAIALWWL